MFVLKGVFLEEPFFFKRFLARVHDFEGREGGVYLGGKTGSICHFAFSLVFQCLEVPTYPDAGKNSTKNVIVTPLFVCPKC